MASAFEMATRAAIREIISQHVSESKFGYVMTHESMADICEDIYGLLVTSRNLKTAGDRFIAQGGIGSGGAGRAPSRGKPL